MENLKKYLNNVPTRYKAYLFLNCPRNNSLAIFYQFSITFFTIPSIIAAFIELHSKNLDEYRGWIKILDIILAIIFSIELFVQIWSSTCLPRYRGLNGFFHIIIDPICLLNFLIVITTIIAMATDHHEAIIVSEVLRGFRILQFFDNKFRLWRLIGAVFWNGRFQLLLCLYFAMILMLSISLLMYLIESTTKGFESYGKSIWFTLITLTTVGYGDVVPTTTSGRIITAFSLIIGASAFALPAGIIGAGLALKVEKEESFRGDLNENHAASVIQNAWRVYRTPLPKTSGTSSFLVHISGSCRPSKSKRSLEQILCVKFIYWLKFKVSCRRFKRSANMLSMMNFQELYSENCLEQMEKINNLENILRNNEAILEQLLSLTRKREKILNRSINSSQSNLESNKKPLQIINSDRYRITNKCIINHRCRWRSKYRKLLTNSIKR